MIRPALLLLLPLLLPQEAPDRGALLDELEAKFRQHPRFEAEFEIKGMEEGKQAYTSATLTADLRRWESRFEIAGTDGEGKPSRVVMHFDNWVAYVETDGQVQRFDQRSYMGGFVKRSAELNAELASILGSEGSPLPEEALALVLQVEPGAKDKKRHFRYTAGVGPRPASWFMELRRKGEMVVRVAEREVVFERPPKTFAIDRETGFLRSMKVADPFNGDVEFRLVRYAVLPPERRLEFPKEAKEATPPEAQIWGNVWGLAIAFLDRVRGAAADWDRIGKAGKAEDVLRLVSRWAARIQELQVEVHRRLGARMYIDYQLDNGTPLAELRKDVARYSAGYVKWMEKGAADSDQALKRTLEDLRSRMKAALEGSGDAGAAILKALDDAPVEKERQALVPVTPEKIFEEALAKTGA